MLLPLVLATNGFPRLPRATWLEASTYRQYVVHDGTDRIKVCFCSAGVLDTMVVQSMMLGENVARGDRSEGSNLPLVFVFPHGSSAATTDGAQLCGKRHDEAAELPTTNEQR